MTEAPTSYGRPVLYALVVLCVYLTYLILRPFLVALVWSAIFAVLFRSLHIALSGRIGRNGAALVTTIVVFLAIVAPAAVLISAMMREVPQISDRLEQTTRAAPRQILRIWDAARALNPVPMPEDPTELITLGLQRLLGFVASRAGGFVADFFGMVGSLAAMLFALFFMLRDGDAMSRKVRDRLPLSPPESERLLRETRDLVIASFGAGLTVAAVQGLIGGLAFLAVGSGAPVFWGILIGFCSLVPIVGAALVWVPAGLGLLLMGEIGRGIIMLVIGALGISLADNVLRPLLLSGRTAVSGLVIFFGLLGGVAAFGFVGLVIGPIILAITARLLDNLRPEPIVSAAVPME